MCRDSSRCRAKEPPPKKKDREDRIRSVQGRRRRRRWWFDRRAHGGRNPKENEEEVGKKETLRNRSNDVYYFVSLLFLFLFTTILLFHSRVHSKKKKGKKNFIFFIAHLVAFSPTHQTAQQILCVVLIHIHKSLSPSSPRERERGSKRPPSGPHRQLLSRCNNNTHVPKSTTFNVTPMRTTKKGRAIVPVTLSLADQSNCYRHPFFSLSFSVVDIVAIFHLQDSRLLIFFFFRSSTSGVHRLHHHNHKRAPVRVPYTYTLAAVV